MTPTPFFVRYGMAMAGILCLTAIVLAFIVPVVSLPLLIAACFVRISRLEWMVKQGKE